METCPQNSWVQVRTHQFTHWTCMNYFNAAFYLLFGLEVLAPHSVAFCDLRLVCVPMKTERHTRPGRPGGKLSAHFHFKLSFIADHDDTVVS